MTELLETPYNPNRPDEAAESEFVVVVVVVCFCDSFLEDGRLRRDKRIHLFGMSCGGVSAMKLRPGLSSASLFLLPLFTMSSSDDDKTTGLSLEQLGLSSPAARMVTGLEA